MKCTGCLQCVDVCGPGALTAAEQDGDLLAMLEDRFEVMTKLPNTPRRFVEDATTGGDVKRLMLDHANYYATTGGHGACRGCGEVTAIRLVTSTSRALAADRRREHMRELDDVLAKLAAKLETVVDDVRRARIQTAIADLEQALYLYEGGPTGNGPAPTVIANSTGCSSVYASTVPFTPYLDPWVNSLFQDAQPLAKGLFEGISAKLAQEVRAMRTAELELADAYDAATHDKSLRMLDWRGFTETEMSLLPAFLTIGGDGASYDIGFGAMSRILASGTPVKMLVLNTGAYSNTGGQASTASFVGQDADLARYGRAHDGKQEARKELGLLAAFHPGVYACVTATALHGHFLKNTVEMLGYTGGAALMDVYTPCGTENGIPEDLSNKRSRLAVESRVSPLFVHDPRAGRTLAERFSLDGNPDVDKAWTSSTLEYLDENGQVQLLTTPLTPAEFAMGETRFKKQFKKLAPDADAVPIAEYVELDAAARAGKVPFVYATDDARRLVKLACSASVVALVEERAAYWRMLQSLAGVDHAKLSAAHKAEVDALKARYEEAAAARETSLDDIARAMADLAASSKAPAAGGGFGGLGFGGAAPAAAAAPAPAATAVLDLPISLAPEDEPLCNDCGTCYQDLPQFFEKTTIVVDGQARVVARQIPGCFDGVEITPELAKRIERVKATCDAEILR